MTQEEKQLLLKDLCGRLPYGVTGVVPVEMFNGNYDIIDGSAEYDTMNLKVRLEGINADTGDIEVVNTDDRYSMYDLTNDYFTVEDFTPYLRPMSSMTEEEKIELKTITKGAIQNISLEDIVVTTDEGFDWLNAHHFDYRGLIEKGLAMEKVVLDDEQCESALKMWNEPLSLK